MISDVINGSMDSDEIVMSSEVDRATNDLRDFMFEHVYIASAAKVEEKKTKNIIERLYEYYLENPEEMPGAELWKNGSLTIERMVCDYIAGMSDRFAINAFTELFIPSPWRV